MSDMITVSELIARHSLLVDRKAVNPGNPGTIEYVNPKDLLIDHSYQRDLNIVHAKKIGQNFTFSQMKIPSGFKTEDGILIIDGQHTCTGAALAGIDKIAVYVIENVDKNISNRAFQSKQFLAINLNNKPVSRYDILRNMVIQEDKTALALMKACNDYGVVPCRNVDRKKPGHISHIDNLTKSWKQVGEKSVRRAMQFSRKYWPNDPILGSVFSGIARFYNKTELGFSPEPVNDDLLYNALTCNGQFNSYESIEENFSEQYSQLKGITATTLADVWRCQAIAKLYAEAKQFAENNKVGV